MRFGQFDREIRGAVAIRVARHRGCPPPTCARSCPATPGTVVELIASTTTRTGLTVQCEIDTRQYPKGMKVSHDEMAAMNITGDILHPEWNYTISARPPV
jgi:hypothetical protein